MEFDKIKYAHKAVQKAKALAAKVNKSTKTTEMLISLSGKW